MKPYNCLICGNRSGNETLRKSGVQGISTFINFLLAKGNCNGYIVEAYGICFILDEKTVSDGKSNVR